MREVLSRRGRKPRKIWAVCPTTPHIFVELHSKRRCKPGASGMPSIQWFQWASANSMPEETTFHKVLKKLTWTCDEIVRVFNKVSYFPMERGLQKSSPSFLGAAAEGFSCSSSSIGGRLYGLITKPLDALKLNDKFSRKLPDSAPPPPFS